MGDRAASRVSSTPSQDSAGLFFIALAVPGFEPSRSPHTLSEIPLFETQTTIVSGLSYIPEASSEVTP
jgi:hypothetical protein